MTGVRNVVTPALAGRLAMTLLVAWLAGQKAGNRERPLVDITSRVRRRP